MRAAETRECGHEVDAAGVRHAGREGFDVAGTLDDAQAIAQPLHHRAPDEHAAFQRVVQGIAFPRHRREQPVLRCERVWPVFMSRKQPVP